MFAVPKTDAFRLAKRTVEVFRAEGLKGVTRRARDLWQLRLNGSYSRWTRLYDTLSASDIAAMQARIPTFAASPILSVVMPVYDPPPGLLRAAIESVLAQAYPAWELCIANDCSTDPEIATILDSYARSDPRIKVVHRTINGHISRASNDALKLATGDWVVLLDHDDLLPAHALFCVADAINAHPNARMFYSDEDKITMKGRRVDPYFKCEWNEGLLRSHNMFSHLGVFRADLVKSVGGFRPGFEGSQDYDLVLRCMDLLDPEDIVHIPYILYHWRMIPGSTAAGVTEKSYAIIAAQKALNEHFARRGISAQAIERPGTGTTRTVFNLPSPPPSVSIIVPTFNHPGMLAACIDSILQKTIYESYEIIIIDNESDDPAAIAYLAGVKKRARIRVLRFPQPFNFSAINNFAVAQSSADVIVMLNNDTTVITPEWLTELVSHAIQPTIGAVGAKLLYPDNTLQHAGLIMGMSGIANPVYRHLPQYYRGHANRAVLGQHISAVTAACCAVRRQVYVEVGGLDEENLPIAFNDIDFCLRLREAGYLNYWTPEAVLYHHESRTRGSDRDPAKRARFENEQRYVREKWAAWIARDPAYSPNLSLQGTNGGFAFPPRVQKPWMRERGS